MEMFRDIKSVLNSSINIIREKAVYMQSFFVVYMY